MPIRSIPAFNEQGKQLILAARRVLKLVHQQVAPLAGHIGGQHTRFALFGVQHLPRRQAQLHEINHAALGKNHPQFRRGIAQDEQQVQQHLPFFFAVLHRWQCPQLAKHAQQGGLFSKTIEHRAKAVLGRLAQAAIGKPAVGGCALAPFSAFCQQKITQTDPLLGIVKGVNMGKPLQRKQVAVLIHTGACVAKNLV